MTRDGQSVGEMRTKQAGLEAGVLVVPPASPAVILAPGACGWEAGSARAAVTLSFLGLNLALPPAGRVLG